MDISIAHRAWVVNVPLVGNYGLISLITQPGDHLRHESTTSTQLVDANDTPLYDLNTNLEWKRPMRLLSVIATLIVLWPTLIFANEYSDPKISKIPQPPIEYPLYEPTEISYPRIETDWTFGQEGLKGHPQYEFRGLWRYLAKETKSRFSRKYNKQLQHFWNNSNEHQFSWNELAQECDEFQNGGNIGWWNRPWREFLSLEKGGSPTIRTIVYGRSGDWFNIGPLIVTHDLKMRLKGTSVYLDGDQPIENLKDRYLQNNAESDPKAVNFHAEEETTWFNHKLWKIKFKPSINLNLNGSDLDFIRNASLKVEADLFLNNGLHFGNIECGARYDVRNRDFELVFFFRLVQW